MKDRTNLSTQEIIEEFPNYPFTKEMIGRLYSMKLLKGFKRADVTYISIQSLHNLVNYRNDLIASDLVKVHS